MKIIWALICNNVSVDQKTNQISIFNVIEDLVFSNKKLSPEEKMTKKTFDFEKPTKVPQNYNLVVYMERDTFFDEENFDPFLRMDFCDPDDKTLGSNESPIKFEDGKKRLRIIASFDSVVLTKSGIYKFNIYSKSSKKESYKKGETIKIDVKIFSDENQQKA